MKIDALRKSYDGKTVLDVEAFELKPGTIYAVLGTNGSGKSTLAKLLSNFITPDGGGRALPAEIRLGYLPQKPYAFHMNLKKNLQLSGAEGEKTQLQMSRFGLEELALQNAKKLSGGETARMALARLLLKDYELLILDEPTAAMDAKATTIAERELMEYREKTRCCILLVTHSVRQAERVSDQVIILSNGHIAESDSTKAVLSSPQTTAGKQFLELFDR